MDPGNFTRREWNTALRRAKLQHWRFHDLRHFAVSQLIEEGADILLLARIAGHKDPSVTLRVYSHLMTERVSEAAERYDPLPQPSAGLS
jgi:integrase